MKGVTPVILILGLIAIIAAIGISYGTMTGFVLFSPNNGADSNAIATGSDGGLVIGDAVPRVTGSLSGAQQNETQTAAQTGATQQNATQNQTSQFSGVGGGGGGGGGGGSCSPTWDCTAWSACSPQGLQSRTCTDTACSSGSNTEARSCQYIPPQEPGVCNGVCLMPSTLSISKAQNQTFGVYVYINTTESVFAAQFDVYYDKTKLNATSATEGEFLKQGGVSTYPVITNDYANGRINYGNTRFGASTGVSGSGILMDVIFSTDAIGTANLELGNVTIVDSSLNALDIPVSGTSVINIAA